MKTIYALLLACGIAGAQDITTVNQSSYGSITAANAACTATSCVWLTSPLNAATATVTLSGRATRPGSTATVEHGHIRVSAFGG